MEPAIDTYIHLQKVEFQEALQNVREIIHAIIPSATEQMGWGMPWWKLDGQWIIGIAGFKNHMSIFPHSGNILAKMETEITWFPHTKAALHFTLEKPLTKEIIEQMIHLRLREARENRKK